MLGLLVEVDALKEGFERHIQTVLPVARGILQSVVDVTMNEQTDISAETTITFWKEAYYSLVMLEKLLNQFPRLFFENDFEVCCCHLILSINCLYILLCFYCMEDLSFWYSIDAELLENLHSRDSFMVGPPPPFGFVIYRT